MTHEEQKPVLGRDPLAQLGGAPVAKTAAKPKPKAKGKAKKRDARKPEGPKRDSPVDPSVEPSEARSAPAGTESSKRRKAKGPARGEGKAGKRKDAKKTRAEKAASPSRPAVDERAGGVSVIPVTPESPPLASGANASARLAAAVQEALRERSARSAEPVATTVDGRGTATEKGPVWRPAPTPEPEGADEYQDEFGLDAAFEARWQQIFDYLYKHYWRVESEGVEELPAEGAAVLVGNHAGVLPYDAAMLKCAVQSLHPQRRTIRPLVPDFVFHLPYLGAFISRVGGVRACQENAQRLLDKGELVGVFPEGVKGLGKLYRDRYQLQRFGRGGFVKLVLRAGVPLHPVAIVGAEEIHPMLGQITWIASKIGIPYVPLTPTFPLLGPLGALPLPSKWRIRIGPAVDLEGATGADAEDPVVVSNLAEKVRSSIQAMVDDLLRQRQSVFFG